MEFGTVKEQWTTIGIPQSQWSGGRVTNTCRTCLHRDFETFGIKLTFRVGKFGQHVQQFVAGVCKCGNGNILNSCPMPPMFYSQLAYSIRRANCSGESNIFYLYFGDERIKNGLFECARKRPAGLLHFAGFFCV